MKCKFKVGDKVQLKNCKKIGISSKNEHLFQLLNIKKEIHNLTGRIVSFKKGFPVITFRIKGFIKNGNFIIGGEYDYCIPPELLQLAKPLANHRLTNIFS